MGLQLDIQNPEDYLTLPAEADLLQWAQAAWQEDGEAGVVLRIVAEADRKSVV